MYILPCVCVYIYIFTQYVWMFNQSLHISVPLHPQAHSGTFYAELHTLGVHSLELLRKTSGAFDPLRSLAWFSW